MKVTVAVGLGRSAAGYRLAEALDERGELERFIASYPRFSLKRFKISQNKVLSFWPLELICRGFYKIPLANKKKVLDYFKVAGFDTLTRSRLRQPDILCGYSGFSVLSFRQARQQGISTILLRGSTHISYQKEILEEEYRRYGLKVQPVNQRILERELQEYELADRIVVSSHWVKRTFTERGVLAEKMRVVPEGVHLLDFFPASAPRLEEDRQFRILFAGQTGFRKGVLYLLQAVKELNLPDCQVWLLGSIEEAIKPFLSKYEDIFKYFGPVPRSDLTRYYSGADVFVLPSIEDGWGLVVGEAMACGTPVIVSQNAGSAEMVVEGETGFVVPVREVEILKAKISYLYQNRTKAKEMGQNALVHVRNFGWEQYQQRMMEVCQELALSKELSVASW